MIIHCGVNEDETWVQQHPEEEEPKTQEGVRANNQQQQHNKFFIIITCNTTTLRTCCSIYLYIIIIIMHLASSYYAIYSQSDQTAQSPRNTSTNTHTPTTKPQQKFWQEFEFTSRDKEQIEQTLLQNQHKCDIVQNAVTKQRGQFIIDKYEKEAMDNWDNFYSSHETKFFKDRHYLVKAFPKEFGIVYGNNYDDSSKGGGNEDGIVGINEAPSDSDGTTRENRHDHVVDSDELFTITEIGCGVGNTVLPLLELDPYIYEPSSESLLCDDKNDDENADENDDENISRYPSYKKKKMFIWGLDFSSVAIDLLRKDERYRNATTDNNDRTRAHVWDITATHPDQINVEIIVHTETQKVPLCLNSSSNISLLLFVLSAISPEKMPQAARHVASTLKPGGTLVFRDYGRYDEAQIKLGTSRNKRLSDNFYVKHDGTRCYYFTTEDVQRLFGKCDEKEEGGSSNELGAGLEVLELKYVQRVYKNRSDDATRKRIWVQARFRKPI